LTFIFNEVNPKFPTDTVAGKFKIAVSSNYMFDSVRFDQQRFNWTMKEFDRYSSAFAFGLLEAGYSHGDRLALWLDQDNSAEILVSTMGASKAGVTVVTFSEKENQDALHSALKDSGARGLLFSPSTTVSEDGSTRADFVNKLMPELDSMYPGDALSLGNYPMLKQIIQTGHNNIRGIIKYKDSLAYVNTALSNLSLPNNDASD
jgi:acyl-CoA synthetase (AMP-forming)/AMP-acid ligase II